MTIEIRQLVIRAVVQPDLDPGAGSRSESAASASPFAHQPAVGSVSQEVVLDNLVAICVRTVLRRLERNRDR